jgi:ATP-binding cassette, subfamily A (ABC1), member 3
LAATDLHKTYPGKGLHAVCGNTLGVKKGQVYGLLGPNGAGKSTMFSMLSMDVARSEGEITILGKDVDKVNLTDVGKSLGMCPQYDSIWEQLDVEENLTFAAELKGLSKEDRVHNMDFIIETMDLQDFRKVLAGNLSGGNKRKLSCALTLMLCPKIEFLDEPTTGVDPVSRRALFRVVRQLSESGIILTTHRMDEAQELCDKIAIMINGRFVIFGSPNYLMEAYGLGYMFTITVNTEKATLDAAKATI